MLREQKKYNISFILGIVLIVISGFLLSYNYIESKKLEVFDKMNIALLETEIPREVVEEIVDDKEEPPIEEPSESPSENPSQPEKPVEVKPKPVDYSKYYIGILEIPKIKLKRGFLDKNSIYNNVDKNIAVIQTSTYPDVDKGNLILAAHTGTSSVSFFTKLHDLTIGDEAYITYNKKKYTYKLVDIYTQPKVGEIAIYRDPDKTALTLVTCTKGTQATQTVFILELINVI